MTDHSNASDGDRAALEAEILGELPGKPAAADRALAAGLASGQYDAGVLAWLRQVREAAGASEAAQRRVLDEAISAYAQSFSLPPETGDIPDGAV